MYDPPAYLWAITIAGPTAVAALTCIVLYGGAERAGLGRRRSALLAGAAAVVLGGWLTASAVIAGHGWYQHAAVVSGRGGRRTWACCWRCAGSRWWRAPWRRRAW